MEFSNLFSAEQLGVWLVENGVETDEDQLFKGMFQFLYVQQHGCRAVVGK
jgi:hypothetical protein